MAKPITTATKQGVITSINEPAEIVKGRPPEFRTATVHPDDGTDAVVFNIIIYNSENFQVNDRVKYVVTDGPKGAIPSSLEKI